MKKLIITFLLAIMVGGCSVNVGNGVKTIDAAEAKQMMDEQDVIIVDVREDYEYEEGHIPGAILIPLGTIDMSVTEKLPDKDATILVYCRSGQRSAKGASRLVNLGYNHIYDFGGIINWPYEISK